MKSPRKDTPNGRPSGVFLLRSVVLPLHFRRWTVSSRPKFWLAILGPFLIYAPCALAQNEKLDRQYQAAVAQYDSGHLSLIHISEPTRLGMISYAVFCL